MICFSCAMVVKKKRVKKKIFDMIYIYILVFKRIDFGEHTRNKILG